MVEIDGQPIVRGENTVSDPFVEIADGAMVGDLGCNEAVVPVVVDEDDLVPGALAMSELRSCRPTALAFADNAMLDVLRSTRIGLTLEDGRMVWVAAGRQIILTEATEPPP